MDYKLAYNQRLFAGSKVRSSYHWARYHWLSEQIRSSGIPSPRVIELGCFDAKTIDFMPEPPSYYLGLDAGWEDGVFRAMDRLKGNCSVELVQCTAPAQIPERGRFDVGVCMETLQHLSDDVAESYLAKLSQLVERKLFVTVPRERGVIFVARRVSKAVLFGRARIPYTWRELFMLSMGKTAKVQRNEYKGFDERKLIRTISRYFKIEKICSVFPRSFPRGLSFTLGIVAASRNASWVFPIQPSATLGRPAVTAAS
jgi:hypothetical protein